VGWNLGKNHPTPSRYRMKRTFCQNKNNIMEEILPKKIALPNEENKERKT